MNVVCSSTSCPYKKGNFCTKSFVMINQFAQCDEFWADNGTPRPKSLFIIDAECKDYFKNKEKEITTDDSKESNGEQESSNNGEDNNGD